MTTPNIATLDSPVYLALESATAEFISALTGIDVKHLTSFQHMPIEALRAFASAIGVVPHTELFGEQYERDVTAAFKRWYKERDQESIIDLLASLLLIDAYTNLSDNGLYLDICFTPSPYRSQYDASYRLYLENVVKYLLPFYSEPGALNVRFCVAYPTTVFVNAAFSGVIYRQYSRRQ